MRAAPKGHRDDPSGDTFIAESVTPLHATGAEGANGAGIGQPGDPAFTLDTHASQAVAFAENNRSEVRFCGGDGQVAAQLTTGGGKPGQGMPCVAVAFGGGNAETLDVATTQSAHGTRIDFESETFVATREVAATLTRGAESAGKGGYAGRRQEDDDNLVAHALRADGFDASEDGTGRGTPIVPVQGVALRGRDGGATAELTGDVMSALRTGGGGGDKPHVLAPLAFDCKAGANTGFAIGDVPGALRGEGHGGGHAAILQQEVPHWRVRRLMPVECERLQGFPDHYTAIPYRGKPAADGPRYKAIGNSMACNVMRWLGIRIDMVDKIQKDLRGDNGGPPLDESTSLETA